MNGNFENPWLSITQQKDLNWRSTTFDSGVTAEWIFDPVTDVGPQIDYRTVDFEVVDFKQNAQYIPRGIRNNLRYLLDCVKENDEYEFRFSFATDVMDDYSLIDFAWDWCKTKERTIDEFYSELIKADAI